MKNILTVVGTRPNIIKVTQFHKVVKKYPHLRHFLVHTGQHFSANMNDVFFDELKLPPPDYSFEIDRTSVLSQIADIIKGLEKVALACKPDIMLVVGDVNSTLAAAIVANKLGITLAHIESGLRSFDRSMPEEHNRLVTDVLADYYFVTESKAIQNLKNEGKRHDTMFFVGNTMIDTLVAFEDEIAKSQILSKLNIIKNEYVLLTMHRPGNVDEEEGLLKIIELINLLTKSTKLVFPIHPRTLGNFNKFGLKQLLDSNENLILQEPAGYLDFQNLVLNAKFVITDSGGIQEETTFRKIPCITLRPNTERPVTADIGSNTLLPFDLESIGETINQIERNEYKSGQIPEFWDGKATERIFEIIDKLI